MRQGRTFLSLLLVLGVVTPVSAIENTLIDFTTFNDNIAQVVQQDQEMYDQVITESPELDIRSHGYPDFSFEAEDWNLENWKINLNASSDTVANQNKSLVKNAPSQEHGNVVGVRLHFNPWPNAFWGQVVMPYFLSPTYLDGKYISQDENRENNGIAVGLLVNVGQIKNVRSWVYGLNYNNTYGVRVQNNVGQVMEYGMGTVRHDGWRRLSWNNKYYTEDARFVKPIINPLYPTSMPFIKFDSMMFYKAEGNVNSNFIGYVRDITVEYDLAILNPQRDIDDEAVWGILAKESIAQRIKTSKRIAEELTLRKNIEALQDANEQATDQQATDQQAATDDQVAQ